MTSNLVTPVFNTPRLLLRPFILQDAAEMFQNYAGDARVTKYMSWEHHKTVEDSEKVIRHWLTRYEEKTLCNWAIIEKLTGRLIGSIGLTDYGLGDPLELGYCLMRELWGKGYTTEAAKEVLRYAFADMGEARIDAYYAHENEASGAVMKKLGMTFVKQIRQQMRKGQPEWLLDIYTITRDQFLQRWPKND